MKNTQGIQQLLSRIIILISALLSEQVKSTGTPHIEYKGLDFTASISPAHPTDPHRIFIVALIKTPTNSLTYSLPVFSGDPLDSLFTRLVKKTASSLSYSTPPTGPVYSFNSPGESGDFYSSLELNLYAVVPHIIEVDYWMSGPDSVDIKMYRSYDSEVEDYSLTPQVITLPDLPPSRIATP